jgi:drug/metabolite transporter (DMT)-like permease
MRARRAQTSVVHCETVPRTATSRLILEPIPVTAPQPRPNLRLGVTEYGLIALQSMLWGSTFFFVAIVRDGMPPITMTAVRLVPACIVLLCVIAWLKQRLPATVSEWVKIVVFSAFNNVVPFILITFAQREVTGGMAAVFNATAPLFTVFLAAIFIAEEKLSWPRVLGILVGIVGVAVLIGINPAATTGSIGARLLLIAAACCYAIGNVFARVLLPGYQPFALATAQMIGSLLLATVLSLLFEQPWTIPSPTPVVWLTIIVMGILGSAFASMCHFTILRRAGATNAMLVTIVLPLTPMLLGSIFLGDTISAREIAGGLIIALALVIIDGRVLTRWLPRRSAAPAEPHP